MSSALIEIHLTPLQLSHAIVALQNMGNRCSRTWKRSPKVENMKIISLRIASSSYSLKARLRTNRTTDLFQERGQEAGWAASVSRTTTNLPPNSTSGYVVASPALLETLSLCAKGATSFGVGNGQMPCDSDGALSVLAQT